MHPLLPRAPSRLVIGSLLAALVATTQGCSLADDGRPSVPSPATMTADTAAYGISAPGPDCYVEPERTADGAYPGPGPHGTVYGLVGTGLDARCGWRQRSEAVVGATVELYPVSVDGDFFSGEHTPIASALTNESGCYLMEGIETPGDYMVVIAEPERAACDSDDYVAPRPGLVEISLQPIAPVAGASFGLAP